MRFGQKQPFFRALGEFVAGWVCDGGCWESFVPGRAFSDAVGFTVMTSLCSGREKVRPVRSDVAANAKKFAQRGKNGLKIAVHGVQGEFFRENAAGVGQVLWSGVTFCVLRGGLCAELE